MLLTEHTTTNTNRPVTFSHRTQRLQEKRQAPSHMTAVLFAFAQTYQTQHLAEAWVISISKPVFGTLPIRWHERTHHGQ